MDNTTMILSSLFTVTILIMVAPSILRINRGRILQNIALWMAIFLGLALAYQTVGPGKNLPPNPNAAPSEELDTIKPRTLAP